MNSFSFIHSFILNIDAVRSSEESVNFYHIARCHIPLKTRIVQIAYKNSICQSNQLILFKAVIGVCCENYKETVSTVCVTDYRHFKTSKQERHVQTTVDSFKMFKASRYCTRNFDRYVIFTNNWLP